MNPAAKGWSRTPLHRANLLGRWGRNKRWEGGSLTDTHAVSVTYADVDYLGIVDVWWCELADWPDRRSLKNHPRGARHCVTRYPRRRNAVVDIGGSQARTDTFRWGWPRFM